MTTFSGGITAANGLRLGGAETVTNTLGFGTGGSLTINSSKLTLGAGTTTGTLAVGANAVTVNGTVGGVSTAHGIVSLAGGTISGTGAITSGAVNGYGTVDLTGSSSSTATWTRQYGRAGHDL